MSNRSALAAIIASVLISLVSGPSFAEAVTYTGTLGGQAIVLELTELEDGPLVGRYSYQSNGADIRLHPLSASQSTAVLAEEAPCTPALCLRADDNLVLDPPLASQFSLHYSADDTKLTGTWRASSSADAMLEVELTRFGERAFERDEAFAYRSLLWVNYNNAPITPETSPYDYAKMQVTLIEGPLQTLGGATYRHVTDPRTKFASPRIVSLPGGGDVGPVNAMLDQRRWAINFAGFECLSNDYLSGVWMPLPFGTGGASLGGIDQERISIEYLSDTVMTIRQVGRGSCGGGAPYDYVSYYTYDVRAGRALDLGQIFRDWDAASDNATAALIDWAVAAYRKTSAYDAEYDAGCLVDDGLVEGLDVSFSQDNVARFMFDDAMDTGCTALIVSVPLVELMDLLTHKAADYFPSLHRENQ